MRGTYCKLSSNITYCLLFKAKMDLDNPECFIDGLLLHPALEKSTGHKSVPTDEILSHLIFDLFEAGDDYLKFTNSLYVTEKQMN